MNNPRYEVRWSEPGPTHWHVWDTELDKNHSYHYIEEAAKNVAEGFNILCERNAEMQRDITALRARLVESEAEAFSQTSRLTGAVVAIENLKRCLAQSEANLSAAQEGMAAITRRVPIIGSAGEYLRGQKHAIEACRMVARAALDAAKEGKP